MVQPVGKQMTREEKEEKVEEFRQKIERYPVVGILDMHNLPSKQLQQMKKEVKDFADIKMSRKTLMHLALEGSQDEEVEDLKQNGAIQPAFIFSEKDPFQLFQLIQENKTSAAADGGEFAPNDIEIPEGDTGIGPGPMLGKLQQAGLNVQVEDGSIHVQQAGTLVEQGEEITNDDAEILNQMGIEPLEIGLDLKLVYSDGELFERQDLDIDTEEYRSDVELASSRAFNLAVNAGYTTERTAPTVIANASQKARNLSISQGIVTGDTAEEIISLASSKAESLESQLDLESVEPEEEEDDDETGEAGEKESSEDGSDEEETGSEEEGKDDTSEEETEETGENEDEETQE